MNILFHACNRPELVGRARKYLPEAEVLDSKTEGELRSVIASSNILVTTNRAYTATAAQIICEHGQRLQLIHFTTSGIDSALEHGLPENVPVTNSAGTHANRIAQHAFALMLALARGLNDALEARRQHQWIHDSLGPKMISLEGATMVLIGLGFVGQEIARKAKAFDMKIIAISRSTEPLANVDVIRPRDQILQALSEADVVALATTYDQTTHHMLNAEAIAALKPGALIINIARGQLIDESAMIEALRTNKIGGAGIDVMTIEPLPTDSPLWDLPNVVMTPHNASGGGGDGQNEKIFAIIKENIARLKTNQPVIRHAYGPERARQIN
jgi:phosphoglycerate dehydrogenase-like enzyme